MPNWIGGPEMVVLVLVIVIVFGWKRLPDAARSLGRSMRIFKAEVEEMKDKPSAASRDTVSGEARHEATRTEPVRDGATYTSTPRVEADAQDRVTPADENPQYRPPMA